MAIDLIVSESRRGTFVLSVKGGNAGEVYQIAHRINKWLEYHCPGWTGYRVPAYPDKQTEGLFYCPTPLSAPRASITPHGIDCLLQAMEKAGVTYCYTSLVYQFVLVPAPGPDEEEDYADELTEAEARAWAQSQTKAVLQAFLIDRSVEIPKRANKSTLVDMVIAHA